MRVLHIASGDLWAGAEVMLCALAVAQSKLPEVEVAVVLFNEGRLAHELRSAGLVVIVHSELQMNPVRLVLRTRKTLSEFGPDLVHTHRIKEDVIGALAVITSARRAKLVRTVHGIDEAERTSWQKRVVAAFHRMLVRLIFERSFAVSRPLAMELGEVFGSNRVAYVANGISVTRTPSTRDVVTDQSIGFIHIGLVARLVPVKRIDIFLRAAAIMLEESPGSCRFSIYGDGPQAGFLKAEAARLQIGNSVCFAGYSNDILEKMQDMDMLFLTSESEGLPMVVLEAMAMELPVVAAAVGELPEVLAHGDCGTLIHRAEPEAYAAAMRKFMHDPAPFRLKAAAAKSRVDEKYSASACARGYVHEYASVLTPLQSGQ